MIHDADLDDEKFQRAECIGIDRVLKGWAKQGMSDQEILRHGLQCFDGLYAFLRRRMNQLLARQDRFDRRIARRSTSAVFAEAFRFWLKLGFISFGGPTGQIAIMQTELVEKKRWISQSRFLHALNFCMLLPGPEAQQLAIYIGWLLHKTWGGIVAGAFFVIPSIFILWTLSFIYAAYGNVPWIAAIFYGLKPAVTAIVLTAVIRIGRKSLKNEVMWALAALAFIAIYFFKAPFPAIVLSAGIIGFLGGLFGNQNSTADRKSIRAIDIVRDRRRRGIAPAYETKFGARVSGLGSLADAMVDADIDRWCDARLGEHAFQRRFVFQQSGGGHFRRRIRSPALRCATSALSLWLAETGPDDGWSWSGGNDARSIDHGAAIRRFHGRVATSGRFAAAGCSHNWRADYNLGDIHAVLSLDFPGRPLHRAIAW